MHISYTGVEEAASYAAADECGPQPATSWAYLAVVVPLTLLYAIVTLVVGIGTAALGVSKFPVG